MKHVCPSRTMLKICIFVIESLPVMRYAQAAHTGGSLAIFEILTAVRKMPIAVCNLVNYKKNCRLLLQLADALRAPIQSRFSRLESGVTWGVSRVKWRGTRGGRGGVGLRVTE